MKTLRALALLSLCLVPLACRSKPPSADVRSADVPCTCGDPSADIEGCAHKLCVEGKHNPDNPDCVCGTLSIQK